MTETDELIAEGTKRGVTITKEECRDFIYARELLATDKTHEAALATVSRFAVLLSTGKRIQSFVAFSLNRPYSEEDRQEDREANARTLAYYARHPVNHEAVARLQHLKLFRPAGPGRTEGVNGFKRRTGLTDEQILEMPEADLKTYV